MITNAKTCTNFGSIAFIYDFFSNLQSSQYVGNAINHLLQGLGVVHLICWQGEGFLNYK
jgi:hypothetical protein